MCMYFYAPLKSLNLKQSHIGLHPNRWVMIPERNNEQDTIKIHMLTKLFGHNFNASRKEKTITKGGKYRKSLITGL